MRSSILVAVVRREIGWACRAVVHAALAGFVPDSVSAAPAVAVQRLADQLGVDAGVLAGYGEREQTRTHHLRLVLPGCPTSCGFGASRQPRIRSAAFSPINIDGAWVWPRMVLGITDASATRRPSTPRTRSCGSTTLASSLPIRQVPTG